MKTGLLILIGLLCLNAYTAEEIYSIRQDAAAFYSPTGFDIEIEDGKFQDLGSGLFYDHSKNLQLKLGLTDNTNGGIIANYSSITVDVTVTPYNSSNIAQTPLPTKTLELSYHGDGSVLLADIKSSTFLHSGYHKYTVHVQPNTSFPSTVYFEAMLVIDRYYHFDENDHSFSIGANAVEFTTSGENKTALTTGNIVSPANIAGDELEIWWDHITGAEVYEVEWTWIDNYDVSLVSQLGASDIQLSERDFELNNTRIITNQQHYRIPLIYSQGYLVYRVRGIGRWTDNAGANIKKKKNGAWSTEGYTLINVNDWPNYIQIGEDHEGSMNWQFQAVYAEDGKKKEIISYFDGTLRNRQTVTKINTNNEAIVGENVYDNQGRAAINILPTPVDFPAIQYYPELNNNAVGTPFSHNDFDWDNNGVGNCEIVSAPMNDSSGASKYYSSNNLVENNWQDYVPSAGGFPYTQTVYTPDNTGRIKAQSGVGADYTIDGEHATNYFYSHAEQEDLNKLFGYQVGYAARYKKNMVVDANGQISISYLDPQGRVIATALAGVNSTGDPDITNTNLLSLDSEVSNAPSITIDALNKEHPDSTDTPIDNNHRLSSGNINSQNDALLLNQNIDAQTEGEVMDFEYILKTDFYEDDCLPEGIELPFSYNLDIHLMNDCGEELMVDISKGNVGGTPSTIGGTYIADDIDASNSHLVYDWNSEPLPVGVYALSKELSVDPVMFQTHLATYLEENTCLLTETDFFIDNIACDTVNPHDSLGLYNLESGTTCFTSEALMLMDLSPNGQYGATDGADIVSVFTDTNALNHGTPAAGTSWRNPTTDYMNPDGNLALIEITHQNGVFTPDIVASAIPGAPIPSTFSVKPEELANLADFLVEWDNEWAKSLLEHHPEYAYFEFMDPICSQSNAVAPLLSSMEYDQELQNINTFADAMTAWGYDLLSGTTIKDIDPFFVINYTHVTDNAFKNTIMTTVMADYKNEGMSLLDYCIEMLFCGNNLSGNCSAPTLLAIINTASTADKDRLWNTYKNIYLAEKQRIIQIFLDVHTIANNSYNGYIDANYPVMPGLSAYTYYPGLIFDPAGPPHINGLYTDAILQANTLIGNTIPTLPWFTGPEISAFQDKTRRFPPIDDLYDSTIPEIDMALGLAEQVENDIYEATGRCKLSFDLEMFLEELAENNYLQSTGISSDELYTLTEDFYTAMGGTIVPGTSIDVNTTNVGADLSISATGATHSIDLSGIAPYSWSDIASFTDFYVVPGTTYEFQILAIIQTATDTVEKVIYGGTGINIESCTTATDADCNRGNVLADNIGVIYSALVDANLLLPSTPPYGLDNIAAGWFEGSELQYQLNAFGSAALANVNITSIIGDDFTITYGNRELTCDFVISPINPAYFMGYSYEDVSQQITFYYTDLSGLQQTALAQLILLENGTPMNTDTYCDCDEADEFMALYEVFLRDVFDTYNANGGSIPTNYFPNSLADIQPYFETSNAFVGVHNVLANFTPPTGTNDNFSFEVDTTCAFAIDFQLTANSYGYGGYVYNPATSTFLANDIPPTAILSVVAIHYQEVTSGIVAGIELILEDQNGIIYNLTEESMSCVNIECEPCIPSQFSLVSCNEKYTTYEAFATLKNATITAEIDQFSEYTEEEFCQTNMGYLVDSYIHYINTIGITDNTHPFYMTLSEFGSTQLHAMADTAAVNDYIAFFGPSLPSTLDITWSDYINNIYVPDNSICPARPRFRDFNEISIEKPPCDELTGNGDLVNASNQYDIYLANVIDQFTENYLTQALDSVVEQLTYTKKQSEYHYTLYYYDQAGNLIQTVPPKEAEDITATMSKAAIEAKRSNPDNAISISDNSILPQFDGYQTNYEYNSLNQLVWQQTPDGGISEFAYDALGRLVVSQNAKQKGNNAVSYTVYDGLGRIIEVGELTLNNTNYTFSDGHLLDGTGNIVPLSATPLQPTIVFPDNIENTTAGHTRREVTVTVYDELPFPTIVSQFEDYAALSTRNRITAVLYFDTYTTTNTYTGYESGTFYDYDIHGNVKELIQDIQDDDLIAVDASQAQKKTQYDYDLVSGNVKEVTYQKGEADQFIHRYCYDADNRITIAETSKDNINWEKDAKYFYYDHGPLARVEIGEEKVQACDYAYTIQGWLKGVNSENLLTSTDQGKDGESSTTNQMNGKDVVGYSLEYFSGDYSARFGNDFLAFSGTYTSPSTTDLFNGNIKEMYTASTKTDETYLGTSHTSYRYDQLNRIRSMQQQELQVGDSPSTSMGNYASTYTYDANGNLETLTRKAENGSGTGQDIDDFTYHYNAGTNQLDHVSDPLGAVLGIDLANQSAGNYAYDAIGQLIQDTQENIANIEWLVTGKVKKIDKTGTLDDIAFEYDAMGNRIIKTLLDHTGNVISKTFYIRDAQGNALTTYELKINDVNGAIANADNLYLSERNIYGSGRLGMEQVDQIIASTEASNVNINEENDTVGSIYAQLQGDKRYELSNHLGNVLEVISDRKLTIETAPGSGVLAYYSPDVISQSDYYPFGMLLPNRHETQGDYRYGFNGMEKDDEVKGNGNSYDFGDRMFDSRVGRWLKTDPLKKAYAGSSPYVFAGNSPIVLIDPDGNILRDKDGNIIITPTGTYADQSNQLSEHRNFSGGKRVSELYRKYERVSIYADDGTPIEAFRLVESYVINKDYNSQGRLINTTKSAVDNKTTDAVADCHGYTFTDNKLWINDNKVNDILEHDNYSRTSEKNAEAVIFKKNGKIVHSAKKTQSGKYNNNAGWTLTQYNKTLKEAARGLTDVSNKANMDFYKKESEDRSLNSLSDKGKNGISEYSTEDVQKAIIYQNMDDGRLAPQRSNPNVDLPANPAKVGPPVPIKKATQQ